MIAQKLLAFTLLGAGWVLWLLLGLSVLSVTVMIERALYFLRRRMSASFPELLKRCRAGDLTGAAGLAKSDAMEAEVFVLEADASGLAVDNPALVTLESHPEPPFPGKVARIDSLAKPRVREVPIQYFGATIGLSTTDREHMKPGERVHAVLTLESKQALTVPRQAVFEREGNTVVYRAQHGKLEPVVVKLGASTPGSVVIEDGLEDGDRIATEAP